MHGLASCVVFMSACSDAGLAIFSSGSWPVMSDDTGAVLMHVCNEHLLGRSENQCRTNSSEKYYCSNRMMLYKIT